MPNQKRQNGGIGSDTTAIPATQYDQLFSGGGFVSEEFSTSQATSKKRKEVMDNNDNIHLTPCCSTPEGTKTKQGKKVKKKDMMG
ncbi:unnamed protein product [Thelazia callipaeda]|uniref:Uncharacterized protein n=1 Tax=Thelazia callipaeda TaxID=103827 RepID=A0A0N5CQB2_THECL|nr:unnamed protein product [Thelazia callipaeda]